MIAIIGEDFGGVFGGKRGILSTKTFVSQPLRQCNQFKPFVYGSQDSYFYGAVLN